MLRKFDFGDALLVIVSHQKILKNMASSHTQKSPRRVIIVSKSSEWDIVSNEDVFSAPEIVNVVLVPSFSNFYFRRRLA